MFNLEADSARDEHPLAFRKSDWNSVMNSLQAIWLLYCLGLNPTFA
jgi:hypothetical protein